MGKEEMVEEMVAVFYLMTQRLKQDAAQCSIFVEATHESRLIAP